MESINKCPNSKLSLHQLRCKVQLGCESEERQIFQYVSFDVTFRFQSLPSGCFNDRLTDTVCYAQIASQLNAVCVSREFHLIESLALEAFSNIKKSLPSSTQLWLRATKEKPPVDNLQGGASFSLGDWEE